LGALPTFQSQVNTAGDYIEIKAGEALTSANNASTSASEASSSATAASLEAAAWVSGASYTAGAVVWTSSDYASYRAKTTHSGITTDPSLDTTRWQNLTGFRQIADFGITATVDEVNKLAGVTATTAEINYLDVTTLGVSQASKAVTSDTNGVTTFADGVNEGFTSVTSTSNATTVNCRVGNVFSHTLTENTTFTFSNPPSTGTAYGFMLKLVQGSTARTVTWPASVDWAIGRTPSISSGSGEIDMFVFMTHDGGTAWYGFTAGQDLS
jgi:hypothetical protein